jgi:hypothetical protein
VVLDFMLISPNSPHPQCCEIWCWVQITRGLFILNYLFSHYWKFFKNFNLKKYWYWRTYRLGMNWANSSLICQPCMGRELNTRFKCLPNTRTNTRSIPFLYRGKNQPLSLIPGTEETGMKSFRKYPIPILAKYERHLKPPGYQD